MRSREEEDGELELTCGPSFASRLPTRSCSAHLDHAGGLAYIMEKVSTLFRFWAVGLLRDARGARPYRESELVELSL